MVFEDNWAYPWPTSMYDPVLKIILRPSHGREPEPNDVSFAAYYDPEMIPGYYSRPKTAEERELDLRYESSARFADDPIAVQSLSTRNIFEGPPRSFRAQAEISGNTLRVKFLKQLQSADEARGDELYWAKAYLDGIKKSNVPIVSAFPRELLIYLLKNYIHLPGLPDDADVPLASHPNLRRIEMCVSQTVMTEILKLNPSDYEQVEPDWYCLASQELNP
ncbi:hypothetical protein [Bradyrhizobium sp. OAE829]|uniref:hypothetical protein n=1 Tax=Bradyrhizobium sp. OAE829 TaxID=2663807 RepID=UPI00178A7766